MMMAKQRLLTWIDALVDVASAVCTVRRLSDRPRDFLDVNHPLSVIMRREYS
jgi:hypothetical protein